MRLQITMVSIWVILQDEIFQHTCYDKRFERSSYLRQKLTFLIALWVILQDKIFCIAD